VLRLAVTCQQAGDNQAALQFFARGEKLAASIGDKQGLAIALIDSAEIKSLQGNRVEALADFQQALRLENAGSTTALAAHWFSFGKFLQKTAVSPRLIYACFSKAQFLLQGDREASGELPANLENETKKEVNATVAALDSATVKSIGHDLNSVVQEALALKF